MEFGSLKRVVKGLLACIEHHAVLTLLKLFIVRFKNRPEVTVCNFTQSWPSCDYRLKIEDFRFLNYFFMEDFYIAIAGLPRGTPRESALAHFLGYGMRNGIRPSILFNSSFYSGRVKLISPTRAIPNESSFFHWLVIGRKHNILPTPLFNAELYRRTSSDLSGSDAELFAHYVRHGVYESRNAHDLFDPDWYCRIVDQLEFKSPLADYALNGEPNGIQPGHTVSVRGFQAGTSALNTALERAAEQFEFDRSIFLRGEISMAIKKAAAIEPLILSDELPRELLRAPYRHSAARVAEIGMRLKQKLSGRSYRTIIASDSIGSSSLAALISQADAEDGERPLLVLTGHYGGDAKIEVDCVLLKSLMPEDEDDARVVVFLDLVRGLAPIRVVNAGSQVAAQVATKYGERLAGTKFCASEVGCR